MGQRSEGPRPLLDAAFGRRADRAQLRLWLPTAPAPFLEGAADNPAAGEPEMILLLRNRNASVTLLRKVAKDPRWARSHEISKSLARHPRTPSGLARKLLAQLYWRDLAEIATDVRLPPGLRRQAEGALAARIEELTLGERAALARCASRGMLPSFRSATEGSVLRALLQNRSLTERDVVGIASREEAPGEVLAWLAANPAWGGRRAVRLAIAGNPRTPVSAALRLLLGLPRRDLRKLAGDHRVPRIVRFGAERRLAEAPARGSEDGED